MDSQVKPWCCRDTDVHSSQYTRQNGNDYQVDVDAEGHTGFSHVCWQTKDVSSSLFDHLSESYHQWILETSQIACVLLACFSSIYQGGYSPPWGPGPVSLRLLTGVSEGLIYLHFLIRWSAADTHHNTAHMLVLINLQSQALNQLTVHVLPICQGRPPFFPATLWHRGLNNLLTIIFLACPSKSLYSSMAMIL